jgi:hypothetical protein
MVITKKKQGNIVFLINSGDTKDRWIDASEASYPWYFAGC